jgi:broad specificity phosphatase PhoE
MCEAERQPLVRILLIRHGPSAHSVPAWLPIDRAGIDQWRADYDAAGSAPDSRAPALTRARVEHADVVVASDLPRALASASLLWPGRPVIVSPLFRELPLHIPSLGRMRAPIPMWALLIHLRWMIDILRKRENRERAAEAADWCVQACRDCGPTAAVAIVTHGVFRRVLAQTLIAKGWTLRGRRSYAPWSVWEFTGSMLPNE